MILIVKSGELYLFFGLYQHESYKELWELGQASEHVQKIDDFHYYEGSFDTRHIYFYDLQGCVEQIAKWKPSRQIIVLNADDLDEFLKEVL